MFDVITNILKIIILGIIKAYKYLISPFLGANCRYFPSCSDYLYLSIQKKGILVGLYLGVIRLIKCNPWGGSGYDPVEKK